MKITAIKAQVRRAERVSIYIDDKYAFSLNHAQLLEQKIRVGLEIDAARQDELKKISEFGKAFERVLNYIMIRPRSQREIEDYCRRKQYTPEDSLALIAKLEGLGYINDMAFAKSWVQSRQLTKSSSERKLCMELKQKGISDAAISEALSSQKYDELAALRALVVKKQKISRYKQDPQKFMQYLVRQGFGYDAVKQVLADTDYS